MCRYGDRRTVEGAVKKEGLAGIIGIHSYVVGQCPYVRSQIFLAWRQNSNSWFSLMLSVICICICWRFTRHLLCPGDLLGLGQKTRCDGGSAMGSICQQSHPERLVSEEGLGGEGRYFRKACVPWEAGRVSRVWPVSVAWKERVCPGGKAGMALTYWGAGDMWGPDPTAVGHCPNSVSSLSF